MGQIKFSNHQNHCVEGWVTHLPHLLYLVTSPRRSLKHEIHATWKKHLAISVEACVNTWSRQAQSMINSRQGRTFKGSSWSYWVFNQSCSPFWKQQLQTWYCAPTTPTLGKCQHKLSGLKKFPTDWPLSKIELCWFLKIRIHILFPFISRHLFLWWNQLFFQKFIGTVAPACKVSVLSTENWPYKRADLTSIQPFYSDQGMPMINFTREYFNYGLLCSKSLT